MNQRRIPPGWHIEKRRDGPMMLMTIRAPNGYTASISNIERNPANVLYMLAEALLDADGVADAAKTGDEQRNGDTK